MPYPNTQLQRPSEHRARTAERQTELGVDFLGILGTLVLIAFAIAAAVRSHRMHEPPSGAQPMDIAAAAAAGGGAFDPAPFMLNALLVPALDADTEPLRWTDPRPIAQCADGTTVLVDHKPLVPGALVPDSTFALEWRAIDCHPFGSAGPRLDGRIRINVFREAEFGAIVESSTMQATLADGRSIAIAPRWLAIARDPAQRAFGVVRLD